MSQPFVTIASQSARHWLSGTDAIRLLNRFDGVVNLANTSGAVLSLVRSPSLLGPFAAVVPELRPSDWQGGDPLSRRALPSIDASVVEWSSMPRWSELRTQRWVDRTATLPAATQRGSLAVLDELGTALARGDRAEAASIAEARAGLGVGLTPSGDDELVGAMHAVWALHPEEASLSLCGPMAEAAAPRTTLLSAAWLRAAASGEAAAPWHALVSALAASRGERSPSVDVAWQGVLAMGETSGAAALSGFVATLARFRG